MEKVRFGIVGCGNMGTGHAKSIMDGKCPEIELVAIADKNPARIEAVKEAYGDKVATFATAEEMFDSGLIEGCIIAVPHYDHPRYVIEALEKGLHAMSEKPAGVYSRQARIMETEAESAGKVFAMMFQMRLSNSYRELHSIVSSGRYGKIKRVHWLVTNWYRPEGYYKTSKWHATWATDGGGVILNQCPHNLDILQWICGTPARVQGFCHEGHYHDIEVEDDVTAYMEWENGATGTFITSTGDAPAIDRLEIFLEEALVVCENGNLKISELASELGQKESDYRKNSTDFFRTVNGTWHDVALDKKDEDQWLKMLLGFSSYLEKNSGSNPSSEPFIVPGSEGRKSLLLSNAIYLSSWEKKMIDIPETGSKEELEFEKKFEDELRKKR